MRRSSLVVRSRLAALLFLIIALAGCGGPTVTMDQDPSAFEEEEEALDARLRDNPDDAEALRDLGSIYIRTSRASDAYDVLKKAYSSRPDDPKVLFYLGLASEEVGRRKAALDLYREFEEVPEESKYHTLMEGRYEWLVRKQAERDVEQLIAEEEKTPADVREDVDPNVVAVVPMDYQGGDEQYAALGRGLAEMFTTDLANVGRLRIVERVRLQALLNELELAQSEYVDQSTAPRVGRLLGAGRLVGGVYDVAEEELRLQVTLADVASGERIPQLDRQQASLDDLFDLQTEVTFSIVDHLGVELTSQERAAIQEVPTQDLQAFLAFSRGLMEEDRGHYGQAAQHFQQAQQIDPGFEQAAERREKAQSAEAGGGSPGEALASESEGEPSEGEEAADEIDLVQQRQESLGGGPMGGYNEERDPSQESQTAEEESKLDDPPDPPTSSGGG